MNRLFVAAYSACLLLGPLGLFPLAAFDAGEVEDAINDEQYEMFVPPGYGNTAVLFIKGRMYTISKGYKEFMKDAPLPAIKRPISSLVGFFHHGAPQDPVTIRAGGAGLEVRTDGGGYFSVSLPAPPGAGWKGSTGVELIAKDGSLFRGTVYVPNPDAKLGVISDIDDTVKMTGVHDKGRVAEEMLFGDAETDKPVPGMAVLYADIARSGREGRRPFHYVSASPYALSDRLVKFFSINRFPSGSLDLMGLDLSKDIMSGIAGRIIRYKKSAIENIFSAFPNRRFLLFADNGQEDPKIYSRLLSSHPDRIEAIYIREVEKGKARQTEYPSFLFFTSPDEVRADLVRRGIIRRD